LHWLLDKDDSDNIADFESFFHATEYNLLSYNISQKETQIGIGKQEMNLNLNLQWTLSLSL